MTTTAKPARRMTDTGATNASLGIVCIVILVVMALMNPAFLTAYNFESMGFFMPELGLLALAMMVAMLTGGIDLSVVGIANLAGIAAGLVFAQLAGEGGTAALGVGPAIIGMVVALLVGMLAGLLNGLLITKVGITPILATLGSGQILTGLALVLTGGPAIVGFPAPWTFLGNGKVFGLPFPLIVFAVVLVALWWLLSRSSFGFKLQLIGSNSKAALYTGIDRGRTILLSYVLTGALAAIAGMLLSGRINAAKSDYGASYLLQAILIAVLGGTNPAGGRGSVVGVTLALVSLVLLASGFQMMRVSNHLIDFIWGGFLILVVAVNAWRQRRGTR